MAEALYDLLFPDDKEAPPSPDDLSYLSRLSSLPLVALQTSEPLSLSQSAHSLQLSLQSLAARSHAPITSAAAHLAALHPALPALASHSRALTPGLQTLVHTTTHFTHLFARTSPHLARRQATLLLARTSARLTDLLGLPALLSSAIAASSLSASSNYAQALDLHAHIKRLLALYPASRLVRSVAAQAEAAMRGMASNLVANLRAHGLKLAGAMRCVGWLRRVVPELAKGDHGVAAVFLACRLANLRSLLAALEPLRELADAEAQAGGKGRGGWEGGQQAERYLKRYIEIFREQSFGIVSMFRSIFPASATAPLETAEANALQPPSPLATFALQLVSLLAGTLRTYLPSVRDRASRESLLTQVLYCAGSLGRLGGEFGLVLALLHDDEEEESESEGDAGDEEREARVQVRRERLREWVEVVKKHRVLAGKLELLASGVGQGKEGR
ncbi:MAG: hypothetical protein M1829_000116 [Trizodia sp. TS-e1964]|nr:MAG: hypothetical protein M1829_000116 [Trizodia sp. TS-e1964]